MLDGILLGLSTVFNTFDATIIIPVILFVICLVYRTGVKKAISSAMYAAAGLLGLNWLIAMATPTLASVITKMTQATGIRLSEVNIGLSAVIVTGYSHNISIVIMGFVFLLQIVLFATRITRVFMVSDLWNNHVFVVFGVYVYVMTNDLVFTLLFSTVLVLMILLLAEIFAKRWSTYNNLSNCALSAPHMMPNMVIAIPVNWLLNKIGADKVKWYPEELQKKLGVFGSAEMIGFLLGAVLGLLANFKSLGSLTAWKEIFQSSFTLCAMMLLMPKILGVFSQAFNALTTASRERNVKTGKEIDFYIAVNDAAGFGAPATMLAGTILAPIILLLAVILPGNLVLPVMDAFIVLFQIQVVTALTKGNIFKTVIIGAVIWTVQLYVASYIITPVTTILYNQFNAPLEAGVMATTVTDSFAPVMYWLASRFKWIALIGMFAVYVVGSLLYRKNKERVNDFIEEQAR